VLGCYKGVHFPCNDENSQTPYFTTTAKQVWLMNGLQTITDPEINQKKKINTATTFTVMSLNLHTYQEFSTNNKKEFQLNKQDALERVRKHKLIFKRISNVINQLEPDVICLQEVGEWDGIAHSKSFGKHSSNAVKQILAMLNNKQYTEFMDWSHYGWKVLKEGTAIISKHPIIHSQSQYLSKPRQDNYNFWKSRKATSIQIAPKEFGTINIFSVHTGWWDDVEEPFQGQFQQLIKWTKLPPHAETTILCGDFNQAAGTAGYSYMMQGFNFSDQYLLANPNGMTDATIGGNIAGWENSAAGKRVDYILMKDTSPLKIQLSQRIFTEQVFGRVSDHLGIYAQFSKN